MNIVIENRDSNNILHGYQEWYGLVTQRGYLKNVLLLRSMYYHGDEVGYEEYHQPKQTTFYIR